MGVSCPRFREGSLGASYGFDGKTLGYVLSLVLIPAIFASYYYNIIKQKLNNYYELFLLSFYFLGFIIVCLTTYKFYGVISFLLIHVLERLAYPYIVNKINRNIASENRATSLSTVALIANIPYAITCVFFASITEVQNIKKLYYIFVFTIAIYFLLQIFGKFLGSRKRVH